MQLQGAGRANSPTDSALVALAGRLGWRGVVVAIAMVVASAVTLAGYAVWQERERYRERAIGSTHNIATALAQVLAGEFDKIDLVLRTVALRRMDLVQSGPARQEALDAVLVQHQKLNPALESVRIVDASGVVRYGRAVGAPPSGDVSDRDYFQRARDDPQAGLIVSGPFLSRATHEWVMIFARRLETADGGFAGMVYANLPTESFHAPLSALRLGPQGAATIRTSDLAMVHRTPDGKSTVGDRKVSTELASIFRTQPTSADYIAATAMDGIERSNSIRKVPGYPLYVLVGLATTDYLQSWQRYAAQVGVLALLSVLVTVVTAMAVWAAWRDLSASLAERDHLNRALAERAHLAEAANRAKTTFLSNMSHEMRTPLNAIMGFAALAGRKSDDDGTKDKMQKIGRASRHLMGVIEDILDISRIEANQMTLDVQPMRLADVLDDMSAVLTDAAHDKGLGFSIEVAPGLEQRRLNGDRKRLTQVLINLAGNAVKFTEKGQITVRVTLVDETEAGVGLRFEVSDTGAGISAHDQERIFVPFQQVDGSLTRAYGGAGLGLAISRRLVQMMDGEIELTSTPGQGSTFTALVRLAPSD